MRKKKRRIKYLDQQRLRYTVVCIRLHSVEKRVRVKVGLLVSPTSSTFPVVLCAIDEAFWI